MTELGIDERLLRTGSLAVLAVVLLVTVFVLRRFGEETRLGAELRERFVFGVPWGTVIVIAAVYAIYYLVQGGGQDGGPIVTGFRSWSLWYPQGMLLSAFTHGSEAHLFGNLFGTVTFAPIAEYAWRHYPDGERADGWPNDPHARIGAFVAAVFLVGVLGSVVVPGAVIGFSAVVFALAGFALVTFPIAPALAMLGVRVLRVVYNSLTDPVVIAQSREQFVRPSWVDIAVQGHLYGLLVGVLLAAALCHYRDETPNAYYVLFAALVFSITRSLQSIYWYLGGERFVLFQALGTAGVFLLAVVITLAALRSDRMLVRPLDLRTGTAALGVLLAIVCALALIGVPYNLVGVEGGEELENGVEVRDYTVTYAEGVEDQYISALDLPIYQGPSVNVSGVIVSSDRRNAWEVSVSKQQLESRGATRLALGDATWRETVVIQRTAWSVVGPNSTYKVFARHDGEWRTLFTADPARADPVIGGRNVTIQPASEFYDVVVTRDGAELERARIPAAGERVSAGGIEFVREERSLVAVYEDTRFRIAKFEF
jgi:membrane associated rhomboid family serine protease